MVLARQMGLDHSRGQEKMKQVEVIFQPSARRGKFTEGMTLLEVSRELGVEIESLCGGSKGCGKCRVRVEEGFFERDKISSRRENLSPLTEEE